MRNSSSIAAFCLGVLLCCVAGTALGQEGYLAQRFEPAAAGAGWLTHDDLKLAGPLGGAFSLTTGYAHSAPDYGFPQPIQDFARANIGFAVRYDRWRLTFDLASPLYVRGVDATSPRLDIASHPDTLMDVRIGLDARLWGAIDGPFRLGASARLFVPSADASDYMSDGTYRALFRILAAGDVGMFTYAANGGFHVRPRTGNEVTYGGAAGWRVPVGVAQSSLVMGLEFNCAQQLVAPQYDMTELLLSARLDMPSPHGHTVRVKVGAGPGDDIDRASGWRFVLGVEVVGLATAETETGL